MLSAPTHTTIPQIRLDFIEVIAQNLLTDAHITEPPAPLITLLEQVAAVNYYDDDFERGFCFERESKRHVHINNKTATARDPYPVARLLGHLKLRHTLIDPRDMTEAQVQKMVGEADTFADCLLTPAAWLRLDCSDGCVTPAKAQSLAQKYSVPLNRMNRRLRSLGIRIV